MKKMFLVLMLAALFAILFTSCEPDAVVASRNISTAADNFEIYRRVVFINGITDNYILMIEGYCSVEFLENKFVVTAKVGPGVYLKHYLGKADNVFPIVEQLEPSAVSDAHYRVTFKPSVIIPTIDVR